MSLTRKGTTVTKIPVKRATRQAQPITSVFKSGAWNGEKCFIIGGGPSLEGFDFSKLNGHKVIGINKAFTRFPSIINYGMDYRLFEALEDGSLGSEITKQWENFPGIRLFLSRSPKEPFNSRVYYVRSLDKVAISYDLEQGIYAGNNSGVGALMLALALGSKKIGLLGYDFKIQEDKNGKPKTHWHEGYPKHPAKPLVKNLEKFRVCIEKVGDDINTQALVANLSSDSALQCFPKMDFDSFVAL